MRRLLAAVFWSVIAAAFIGPGTVTTAAAAGARFGVDLLWALTFSTIACLALQEAAARLTAVSGRDLGEALRARHRTGVAGATVVALVVGAIIVGCAAYQAGNILGATAGLALLPIGASPALLTLGVGAVAGILLWNRSPRTIARLLSLLVALMGIAFLWTAVSLRPPLGALVRGALVPTSPAGAGLLSIALVGTTVVPYNLFLGSGIARGQDLRDLRFGLTVAVGLGGLISMGVLVVGTAVRGPFGFVATASVLAQRLGPWAGLLFALGLAAAGLSSAVTAPLAAALTARGLFARSPADPRWAPGSARYRATWMGVLAVGLASGLSGVRPIPVILLAQALNGVLLPVAAVFLLVAVNDRRLMGERGCNGPLSNAVLVGVVGIAILLGTAAVLRAGAAALGDPSPSGGRLLLAGVAVVAALAVPIAAALRRARSRPVADGAGAPRRAPERPPSRG